MKPKRIKQLREIISQPDYIVKRCMAMWHESDLWHDDFRVFKKHWMLRASIRYRKKAMFYSHKLD